MIRNLLVPLDGTSLAERAMQESIALARQLGASITGFVAEPDPPMPQEGSSMPRYMKEREAHGVQADTHAHELLSRLGALAHAAGVAFSALLFGSHTKQVMTLTKAPLLVLH